MPRFSRGAGSLSSNIRAKGETADKKRGAQISVASNRSYRCEFADG